jgi:hypothetical protein
LRGARLEGKKNGLPIESVIAKQLTNWERKPVSQTAFRLIVGVSIVAEVDRHVAQLLDQHRALIGDVIMRLYLKELSPASTFQFEQELEAAGKELMRLLLEWTLNQLEPEDADQMPKIIRWQCGQYRRENQKSPNRHVATRFGTITLRRYPYRWRQRESEPSIFPLEMKLGLVEHATPAFADTVAREMADAGASQQRVIEKLKRDHNVSLGVPRLRRIVAGEAEERAAFRHQCQVARVLELLEIADKSSGNRKPVLAVGRDGISVCNQPHGHWEVASVGTMTVHDRSGKRLGTVYLARMPESLQVELTRQLKQLIVDVLKGCKRLPRLCYVTDAGSNECGFFNNVLRHLRDPRVGKSKQRLKWTRIVDYFHAAERITTMAEQLFGSESKAGRSWARRMRKLLLKPNGPSRVLHSAAAMLARRKLSKKREEDFHTAYEYIRTRTGQMQYHQYRQDHLPIGSGVTEAACKTVFTQRLKLSGMRWKTDGGQAILDLRVILLSGIWHQVRQATLQARAPNVTRPYQKSHKNTHRIAA